jgi:hypothetical protein
MLTRDTMLVHRLLTSQWPFKRAVIARRAHPGSTHALKPLAKQAGHAERQLTVDPAPEILPVSR